MPPRWNAARQHWEIDAHVTLPNGKVRRLRRRSPINTKAAATAYEQKAVAELLASSASGRSGPAPRFEPFAREYLQKYAAGNNRASTFAAAEQTCRDHLIPAFGRLPLDEIDEEAIEGFKTAKLRTHSAQTVKNHLAVLRRILTLAVEWKRLGRVPKVRMPKVPPQPFDHLDIEEAERLLEAADRTGNGWAVLLRVAVRTGLRAGELRGLQWPDIDRARGTLTVRRSVVLGRVQPPKGNKHRTIPLPIDARSALEVLHARRTKGCPWVFEGRDGGPVTVSGIGRGLARACEAAGLRRLHPHDLRHTYASQLVELGVPLRVVQELLGHSTITTTERYAHLAPGATAAAVQRLDAATREAAARAGESPRTGASTEQGSTERSGK